IGCLLPFVFCQNPPQVVPMSVSRSHVDAPHVYLVASQRQRGRWWRPKRGTGRHTRGSHRASCSFSCWRYSISLLLTPRGVGLLRTVVALVRRPVRTSSRQRE